MSNDNFFSSIRADRGVLIKQNKKNQLVFSFIGDKGPFNVTFDNEKADALAEHILEMTRDKADAIGVMEHVNKVKKSVEKDYGLNNTDHTSLLREVDPEGHPFFHGHKVDEPLCGEDE